MILYVPDGSEDLYRAAEGWKDFWKIYPLSEFHGGESGVMNVNGDNGLTVTQTDGCFVLRAKRIMDKVMGYDVSGKTVYVSKAGTNEVKISKTEFVSPYIILRVCYDDGSNETIKLKP